MFKDEHRYYAFWCPNEPELEQINRATFEIIHDQHWGLEQYHRALKQVANIERFQVRKTEGVAFFPDECYNFPKNLLKITTKKMNKSCPKCGSSNIRKNGHRGEKQNYQCKDCKRQYLVRLTL